MSGKKIKHYYHVVNGATPRSGEESYWDGNIVWITPADYTTFDMYINHSRRMITDEGLASCGTTLVPIRSIVVSNRAPIGLISIASIELCTSQGCKCLVPYKDINEKYVYYYLSTQEKELNALGRGTTFLELSSSDLANYPLSVPPAERQQIIAAYLDHKTAQIDRLIADKQKLIELLKEQRQSIISEAVTKGLDASAPMKDSGIEWIGEIPAHWNIVPLFAVASENREKNIGNSNNNLLSLSYGQIVNKDIETNFGLLPESFETYQVVHDGYTILRLTDLQNDKRSLRTGFVRQSGIITSAYVGLIPSDRINGKYLTDLLHAYDVMKIYYNLGNGVRQSMNYKDLRRLPIVLPPLDEQLQISTHIKTSTEKLDENVTRIMNQITLLKEYRQSIISEAVTGKYIVPAVDAPAEAKPERQANIHFKRRVLAAKILDELCDEPTLGHVKLEKILFLSEYCGQLDLHTQFTRHAAGPYSPQTLRSIDSQLKKSKWFSYSKSANKSNKYTRLSDFDKYVGYYESYFDAEQRSTIDKLLSLFRTARTIQCEIVATLYGAWNDFLLEGITPSDTQIIDEVLSNWHEEKERISHERWQGALNWMRENAIIPVGYGESTKGGAV